MESVLFCLSQVRRAPRSALFPYTTLFRSIICAQIKLPELIRQQHQAAVGHVEEVSNEAEFRDRKSTRLNSSHRCISYAVFCLKKKRRSPSSLSHASSTPLPRPPRHPSASA